MKITYKLILNFKLVSNFSRLLFTLQSRVMSQSQESASELVEKLVEANEGVSSLFFIIKKSEIPTIPPQFYSRRTKIRPKMSKIQSSSSLNWITT